MRSKILIVSGLCGLLAIPALGQTDVAGTTGPDRWAQLGGSKQRREDIRATLVDATRRDVLPGASVLVYRNDELVLDEAFGIANPDERAFGTDEVCRIASISKPITATLIAVLVDRGVLAFDDPVDKHLPEFATATLASGQSVRAPTIRELLSHTSGLPGNKDRTRNDTPSAASGSLEDVVREIVTGGFATAPGTTYSYSRLGYDVVARAAEVASGRPFEILLREELLTPLGMTATTFRPSAEVLAGMPRRYKPKDPGFEPAAAARAPIAEYVNCAGGLFATADDLAAVMRLHLNAGRHGGRTLVREATLSEMYRPQPASPEYGLGFQLDRITAGEARRLRHGGSTGTLIWFDRDASLAFVGLSQIDSRRASPVWSTVSDLVFRAWGVERAPATVSDDEDPDAARRARFKRLDSNNDGKLSREELPERLRKVFDRFDEDGDEMLSEEEFVAGSRQRRKTEP